MNEIVFELPSGRISTIREYNPFVANAIGDQGLEQSGLAWFKAASGVFITIDNEPFPKWADHRKDVIETCEKMLMNDLTSAIFYSVAKYLEDGIYYGPIELPTGDEYDNQEGIRILDEDGQLLNQFRPPKYPLGNLSSHEWSQEIPELDGASVKFKFDLITGKAFSKITSSNADNILEQFQARNAMYEDKEKGRMVPIDPNKMTTPSWATKAIGKAVREYDPVIQYSVKVRSKGRSHKVSLFGQQLFFLQDFL